jgi:hypothetical protein
MMGRPGPPCERGVEDPPRRAPPDRALSPDAFARHARPPPGGCHSPLDIERDTAAPIQTDRLEYRLLRTTLGVETEIGYELTNATAGPIYIVNCNGSTEVRLEKQVHGEWVHAWGKSVPDCLGPPIVLEPGEVTERTLSVFGGDPGCRCAPQFAFEDRERTYRLVLIEVRDAFDEETLSFGAPVPLDARVSNPFRLRK